jgi:hypothetical protein
VGCGGGLPRIAYSRNWALDAAFFVPAPRISSVWAHSPSKAARTWRVRTHAERGPAMDCLTLRIRVIGPSTRRYHNDALKIPSFDTLTLESDVHLVRETGAERDTALGCLTLRIREIGPSARRFSCQRLECPLFWRTHRQKRRVLSAWGPTPSGIRPWTASHCVFTKLGPRLGDITTTPRRFPLLTRPPWIVMYICRVRPGQCVTRRWAASLCVFAKLGPRRGDFRTSTSGTPWFGALTVHSGAYLARGDPSRAGRGGGLPRIAHSRNWALDSAIAQRRLEDSLF